MPALLATIFRVGWPWLVRAASALFIVDTVRNFTKEEENTMIEGTRQAEANGLSESEGKQLVAAITYDKIESEGKSPDDFWNGLSPSEKEALEFSPESLRRSMDRTKFGGFAGALLFVAAAVAAGVAAKRGIPIGVKTLGKIAEARKSGASALQLMTIFEEGKILGLSRVWVPAATAGLLTAGGYYVSGLTNNMNDADLWGRIFLGQAADDFAKAQKQKTTSSGGGGGSLTTSQGPRTIIRMVEEKKPMQFLGTLFSMKLGKLEHFDRAIDDEITDMADLETDVKLNINNWLKTLPGRMGYSIVIRKDPVDETGVQQSGIWATATLHILQLSGKIMPIDTILLGPVSPQVRLELAKSTKTIETQIDGIISAQEIREIDIPNGVVDIFSADGTRATLNNNTETKPKTESKVVEQANEPIPEPIGGGGTFYLYNPNGSPQRMTLDNAYTARDQMKKGYIQITRAEFQEDINKARTIIENRTATPTAYAPITNTQQSQSSNQVRSSGSGTSGTVSALASAGTLRFGAQGEAVREIQTMLNILGENLVVDGVWGVKTDSAVRKFQTLNNLDVDGVVGVQTKAKLFERSRQGI